MEIRDPINADLCPKLGKSMSVVIYYKHIQYSSNIFIMYYICILQAHTAYKISTIHHHITCLFVHYPWDTISFSVKEATLNEIVEPIDL